MRTYLIDREGSYHFPKHVFIGFVPLIFWNKVTYSIHRVILFKEKFHTFIVFFFIIAKDSVIPEETFFRQHQLLLI